MINKISRRKDFANVDYAVLLPPKNALFAPLLDIKPFLTMKNLKHCFKWPTPLECYDRDSLLILVWGCQHILILALDFFSTQWPTYGAHILQGLLRRISPISDRQYSLRFKKNIFLNLLDFIQYTVLYIYIFIPIVSKYKNHVL